MRYINWSLIALGLICVGVLSTNANCTSIERVEPLNWWVGMKSPELQLLVYGDDISRYTPESSYSGVSIVKTHLTDNSNYLFIDLVIEPNTKAGTMNIQFSKPGAKSFSYQYELHDRKQGSEQRQGFNASDVIYLITPDRFVNGDLDNDEVDSLKEGLNRSYKGGRHGGDIQGIINSLDYISDMGFTQLWINPVLENDMAKYSYHGYSTTDYYKVDPRYGSNELYRALVEDANSKGIGVIKDVILNHIGSEHWWMKDLPAKDWINNDAKFVGTTHLREAIHDPYATEKDKRGFDEGWFVPTMPDLNQKNPFLANYLVQNSIWWVEYAGLSGIRLDTYSYPNKDFLTVWNRRLMAEYPHFNIVGEEWTLNPAITAYWQKGSKRHDDYESDLPSVFDFPLQDALVKSLTEEEKWNSGWVSTYTSLSNDFLYGDPYNLVTFPDNHDMSRIYSQLNEDVELTKMALTFFATMRGIPQYYYGTEILMKGIDDHGIIRTDFAGGWADDQTSAFSGKGLTIDQISTQAYFKKLLNWRKNNEIIHEGKLLHYAKDSGVYVYFRYIPEQKNKRVMVVMNKTDKAFKASLSRYSEILPKNKYKAVNVISSETVDWIDTMSFPAKAATVIELQSY